MNIQELEEKYYFHDSGINAINFDTENKQLTFSIELCYWAQEWHNEGDPEFMELELIFEGVTEYNGLTGEFECLTILDGMVKDNKWRFNILDELHSEYYEYDFTPSNLYVKHIRTFDD